MSKKNKKKYSDIIVSSGFMRVLKNKGILEITNLKLDQLKKFFLILHLHIKIEFWWIVSDWYDYYFEETLHKFLCNLFKNLCILHMFSCNYTSSWNALTGNWPILKISANFQDWPYLFCIQSSLNPQALACLQKPGLK